jgi:hypothetical protein
MRIHNNGNVGIGTTSPSTMLDVNGIVNATAYTGTTITDLSNLGLFGSNTAVYGSNAVVSLSNYTYGSNATNITWGSNTLISLSNYSYGMNTSKKKKVTTTRFPRRLIKEKAEVRQSQGSVPPSLTVVT